MKPQYTGEQQRAIDHYCVILDGFADGATVAGSDGVQRQGTVHDVLGFVEDEAVADYLEEYAERIGLEASAHGEATP